MSPPHSIIIHKFFKSVRCTVTISYFFYHVFLCKLVNCVLKKKCFLMCIESFLKKTTFLTHTFIPSLS